MYATVSVKTSEVQTPRVDEHDTHVTLTVTEHVHGRDLHGDPDGYAAGTVHLQADSLGDLAEFLGTAYQAVCQAIADAHPVVDVEAEKSKIRAALNTYDGFGGDNSQHEAERALADRYRRQFAPGGTAA